PIAGNCLPHIDVFLENGYTKEEVKMIEETRKILHYSGLKITATAVRVPVLNSHSESINIELEKPFELDDVVNLFKNSKGLTVYDDVKELKYPTPLMVSGKNDIFVGRIRRDFSIDNGLNLWVVADNIRIGAALNAVQIAELLTRSDD
ncbi:aspartate-semialdehyde dehydrogenase, partial [Clostridium perfringens]|uniref:aspartate-semialdehyde dehydrogenase n=1 Tax=Clostridium perfringens TaxID=1502 RepID=UPI002AC59B47